VFRRFDQRVGQKLRANLAPGEYLVPRQTGELSTSAQRQALLNRMTVMASKGCIPEMFDDLRQLLSLPESGVELISADAKQISEAIRTGYAYEASRNNWSEFMNDVRELKSFPAGNSAIRALASGMFAMAKGYPDSLGGKLEKLRVAFGLVVASIK